jgi:hypothetical protein
MGPPSIFGGNVVCEGTSAGIATIDRKTSPLKLSLFVDIRTTLLQDTSG